MQRLRKIAEVPLQALRLLFRNDPLRMAGATAFFSTFALPGILIVIVQVFSHIVGPQTIRRGLGSTLRGTFGPEAQQQIVQAIRSIRSLADSWYIAIGGFIFLLFVVTTLFKIIRGSIDQLWRMRAVKRKQRFLYSLINRTRSVLIILFAGVLVVVTIGIELLQALINSRIIRLSKTAAMWVDIGLDYVFTIAIVGCWLVAVFRYLTNGRPTWRVAWVGAGITALLFTIGKAILGILLTYSNVTTIYGASASTIVLLLFIFYVSLILYFGAAFTTTYAKAIGRPILPAPHAARYRITAVDEKAV